MVSNAYTCTLQFLLSGELIFVLLLYIQKHALQLIPPIAARLQTLQSLSLEKLTEQQQSFETLFRFLLKMMSSSLRNFHNRE